jgi:hypothetical protein
VVGFFLSDSLVLDSRVEVVVNAGSGHGLVKLAVLPSIQNCLVSR